MATYKYDRYGNSLGTSGTLASANVYRFSSSKELISWGFYYYGYRFYDPNLQRWLNRDPIQEWGGINLYQFVSNNPFDNVDTDGLDVYRVNRRLGGGPPGSRYNPVSHTFVFTTNPDGSVASTYSWGNGADPHGWNRNRPEDISAAEEALLYNKAKRKGDASLDPFVEDAFNRLRRRKHPNLGIIFNCKSEASKLIREAKKIQNEE